jgi:hypothetical protein
MILFLETDILDMPNIERTNQRGKRYWESTRSGSKAVEGDDKVRSLIQNSRSFIFNLSMIHATFTDMFVTPNTIYFELYLLNRR